MPGCEVWDLVKVPFPYTNRPVQQRRPALVVAVPDAPGAPELLWVLMVTSAANRGWPGDVVVSDLAAAGLPAPSVVRSAKIAMQSGSGSSPLRTVPESPRHCAAALLRPWPADPWLQRQPQSRRSGLMNRVSDAAAAIVILA